MYGAARAVNMGIWRAKVLNLVDSGKMRVALASYPRSGNTWVRILIEEATGLASGSLYQEQDGILERSSEGVVIKTHSLDSYRYTHAVHLVRNPFDAIESFYSFKKDFWGSTLSWDEHVRIEVAAWRRHFEHWQAVTIPTYRIRYEDVRAAPEKQLQDLLGWIGQDVPEDQVIKAVQGATLARLRESRGARGQDFFRRGSSGEGKVRFSQEQRHLVTVQLAHYMSMLGYEASRER